MRNEYKILKGTPEAKTPFGRTVHRLENNIKMYLKGIWPEDVDCFRLN